MKIINPMCQNCICLNLSCEGESGMFYSGCIYKKTDKNFDKEFYNVVNYIYDKSNDEMMTIARAIKSGAKIHPLVKRAFEKVLDINYAARLNVYKFYYDQEV